MRKHRLRGAACAVLGSLFLAAVWIPVPAPVAADDASDGEAAVQAVAAYFDTEPAELLSAETLTPGESISDWLALSLGRAGWDRGTETYLHRLEEEVTRRYQRDQGLSDRKATEWQRICLTVMALGGDPTAFGTDADGRPVDLLAEGTYDWDRTESFDTQGLNAWIFALLTMDAAEVSVPEDARFTREAILDHILHAQDASGGFGLSGGADVDITAMALQALAPYRDGAAKDAVARAIDYLADAQDMQGSFGGNASSTAEVITALCCLGIDPGTDPRFCKAGGSALDGLKLFRLPSGLYCHGMGEPENLFATREAVTAFVAVDRLRGGCRSLYDLRPEPDGSRMPEYGTSGVSGHRVVWIAVAVLLAAPAVGICVKKGKRKQHV